MYRSGALRSLARSVIKSPGPIARPELQKTGSQYRIHSLAYIKDLRRASLPAFAPCKPVTKALVRYAATHPGTPFDFIDKKGEQKVAETKIEQHPEEVSAESSVRHVLHEEGVEEKERDIDMLAGVKSDMV